MSKLTVRFAIEKETKSTIRYQEVPGEGKPPLIGTLYVQKWVFSPPKKTLVLQLGDEADFAAPDAPAAASTPAPEKGKGKGKGGKSKTPAASTVPDTLMGVPVERAAA